MNMTIKHGINYANVTLKVGSLWFLVLLRVTQHISQKIKYVMLSLLLKK